MRSTTLEVKERFEIGLYDRSPKILVQVITLAAPTAAPNLVQIRSLRSSGQMGEIYRNFYLFIYLL